MNDFFRDLVLELSPGFDVDCLSDSDYEFLEKVYDTGYGSSDYDVEKLYVEYNVSDELKKLSDLVGYAGYEES